VETAQDGKAPVGRAVVDVDDLERLVVRLERCRYLPVELLDRVLLVVQRNDDRDHAPRVQAGQAGAVPRYGSRPCQGS